MTSLRVQCLRNGRIEWVECSCCASSSIRRNGSAYGCFLWPWHLKHLFNNDRNSRDNHWRIFSDFFVKRVVGDVAVESVLLAEGCLCLRLDLHLDRLADRQNVVRVVIIGLNDLDQFHNRAVVSLDALALEELCDKAIAVLNKLPVT